jgi:hypothetical protein
VTTALVLLFASTIAGLTTALFFRVWSLLLISPVIAVLVSIVLQSYGFGFWTGIPIVVGCLTACQLAYLVSAFKRHNGILVQDDSDGAPGYDGQRDIGDENE